MSTGNQQAPQDDGSNFEEIEVDSLVAALEGAQADLDGNAQGGDAQQAQQLPEFEAPAFWKQETKEAWKALHGYAEGRPHLQRLHEQWGQTQSYLGGLQQEHAQMRNQFGPLNEFLQPYAQQWAQEGMDPVSGLRQVMAFRDGMIRNPQETLLNLAQSFGVDLQQAIAEAPYVLPEVQQLQSRIAQMEEASRQAEMGQQRQQQQWLHQQVQAFETEVDDQGNAKHPHFRDVVQDMLYLHARGYAANPHEAYAQAVAAHPRFKAEAAERARADAIRKAQGNNSRVAQTVAKSGVSKPSPKRGESASKQSLDQAMNDAYEELSNR